MIWGAALLDWFCQPDPTALRAEWAGGLEGLSGTTPLAWWAAGHYTGQVRHQLLRLRDHPASNGLKPWLPALLPLVAEAAAGMPQRGLVVPVPSWKRRSNPLPGLLARSLSQQLNWRLEPGVLHRSRPVLGQHHLGRRLRLANQRGAFQASRAVRLVPGPRTPVLLVDDILTTGATACAAAEALQMAGWRVIGLACLARTPGRGRWGCDLGSDRRHGDRPG